MITIVDYGVGNLGSIRNMLKKLGVESVVTSEPGQIAQAAKLILPGVGAFDTGMRNLARLGLLEPLHRQVRERRRPVLGICLGMQLMARRSEEGEEAGLGWVDAEVVRFEPAALTGLKVPHMGWNVVHAAKPSALLADMEGEQRFYFVHSYHMRCSDPADVLLRASYGTEFDAGIEHENVAGVQFHPEKSHRFGLRLLKNFAERR
jgi:imidazole glycerol-phosphate synthase subunit HisH